MAEIIEALLIALLIELLKAAWERLRRNRRTR